MPMPNYKDILQGLFITFILISIILSYKIVKMGPFIFPIGVVTIAISFIINCVYIELYGKEESLKLIVISLFCQLPTTILASLLSQMPSFNDSYTQYFFVLNRTPLIAFADAICLAIAYWVNTFIMSETRKYGNKFFPIRSIFATLSGEITYNFIWVFITMSNEISFRQEIKIATSMIIAKLVLAIVFSFPGVIVLLFLKKNLFKEIDKKII